MGCLYAAGIAETGAETWVLDHRNATVTALDQRGIVLDTDEGERAVRVHASSDPHDVPPVDLALLLVKAPALDAAAAAAQVALAADGFVLPLQNGFGHGERVAAHVPRARVLHGVTYAGAVRLAPGRIRPTGYEPTVFGPLEPRALDELEAVRSLIEAAGFGPRVEADPVRAIWEKSVVACALNAPTALIRCRLGGLKTPAGLTLARVLLDEALALASAEGIDIDGDKQHVTMERLVGERAETVPSMLQDVLTGRSTENESLNGYIASRSAVLGLAAPWNACIASVMRALEEGWPERVDVSGESRSAHG